MKSNKDVLHNHRKLIKGDSLVASFMASVKDCISEMECNL